MRETRRRGVFEMLLSDILFSKHCLDMKPIVDELAPILGKTLYACKYKYTYVYLHVYRDARVCMHDLRHCCRQSKYIVHIYIYTHIFILSHVTDVFVCVYAVVCTYV